jgi:predicted XRE-type DNA-binding protein
MPPPDTVANARAAARPPGDGPARKGSGGSLIGSRASSDRLALLSTRRGLGSHAVRPEKPSRPDPAPSPEQLESTEIPVTPSSGNVFADLGFAEPEEELTKAQLASHIRQIIKRRRLTQVAAASLMGIDQPKVSALLNGRLAKLLQRAPDAPAHHARPGRRDHPQGQAARPRPRTSMPATPKTGADQFHDDTIPSVIAYEDRLRRRQRRARQGGGVECRGRGSGSPPAGAGCRGGSAGRKSPRSGPARRSCPRTSPSPGR